DLRVDLRRRGIRRLRMRIGIARVRVGQKLVAIRNTVHVWIRIEHIRIAEVQVVLREPCLVSRIGSGHRWRNASAWGWNRGRHFARWSFANGRGSLAGGVSRTGGSGILRLRRDRL